MLSSSRFVVAIHAMSVLARFTGKGPVCSALVAQSVHTNPVVIRRLMTELEKAGLVHSVAGRSGGFELNRDPGADHAGGRLFRGRGRERVPHAQDGPALAVPGGSTAWARCCPRRSRRRNARCIHRSPRHRCATSPSPSSDRASWPTPTARAKASPLLSLLALGNFVVGMGVFVVIGIVSPDCRGAGRFARPMPASC